MLWQRSTWLQTLDEKTISAVYLTIDQLRHRQWDIPFLQNAETTAKWYSKIHSMIYGISFRGCLLCSVIMEYTIVAVSVDSWNNILRLSHRSRIMEYHRGCLGWSAVDLMRWLVAMNGLCALPWSPCKWMVRWHALCKWKHARAIKWYQIPFYNKPQLSHSSALRQSRQKGLYCTHIASESERRNSLLTNK